MKKYYSIDNILKKDCEYNIIFGQRSNGKSFAVKHYVGERAIDPNKKFILLRRQQVDTTPSANTNYFKDFNHKKIYGEDCIGMQIRGGQIFAVYKHSDKHTKIPVKLVGYVCSLSSNAHYTGQNFNDVENIVYEEVISRSIYLNNEPDILQDFVSTVFRERNDGRVWLIGNTISRLCPYFTKWELKGIPKQKDGTIEIYEQHTDRYDDDGNELITRIACERSENIKAESKMFFGQRSKMITEGAWQSDEHPHLERRLETYDILYDIVFEYSKFRYYARYLYDPENECHFWYIEPKTTEIKKGTRVCSDRFYTNDLCTIGLVSLSPEERVILNQISQQNCVFCDNLTGTEFYQAFRMLGRLQPAM